MKMDMDSEVFSKTGFHVWYTIPHSGYQKEVYWSSKLKEARTYARMIVRNHGKTYKVDIRTDEQGVIYQWFDDKA